MAGFWHLSHHQMRDPNGAVYKGALARFYSATTLLPLVVYQDYGLGTPHPPVVAANAYGVFPPVFFNETDEFYRQIITTAEGVLIPGTDVGTLPIIGPTGGGGGPVVPVDPNALLKTGDPLWVPVSGSRSGFVRLNGRTIGSATSGASERSNADCENLFLYNWTNFSDAFCPVTGGRGPSAAADWVANKPIQLLDMRNKGPFGLDDMGNAAANGFAGLPFAQGNATTPASRGGKARHTLVTGEIPPLTGTTSSEEVTMQVLLFSAAIGAGGLVIIQNIDAGATPKNTDPHDHDVTVNVGGGAPHDTMSPFMLGTWFQKL